MADGLNMQERVREPESALLPGISAAPSHPIATVGAGSSEPGPPRPARWSYDFNENGEARAYFPGEVDYGEEEAPLEFPVISVVQPASVQLPISGAPSIVCQLAIPAGDWDITGEVWFQGGQNTQNYIAALNTIPNQINGIPSVAQSTLTFYYGATPNLNGGVIIGSFAPLRFQLIGPVTFYINASVMYTGGTPTTGGSITARQFPNPNLAQTIDLDPSEIVPLALPEVVNEGDLDRASDSPGNVGGDHRRLVSWRSYRRFALSLVAALAIGGALLAAGRVSPKAEPPVVVLKYGDISFPAFRHLVTDR